MPCHAIDREHDTPSASFSPDSGVYAEMRDGVRLSFFDLAVALGAYPDWQTAKSDLASRYLGTPACALGLALV